MYIQNKKTSRQSESNIKVTQNHPQIACVFHSNQTITNFCCNKQCLLPMCPVCVALHSQQHRQQKTHGQFLSLIQVIQNAQNFVIKKCKFLQELSQEYTQDYWNKQKMIQILKLKIQEYKKKVIRQVERQFDEILFQFTKKSNQFHDNIHDKYKELENQIQYLYQNLKSEMENFSKDNQKILKNVIKFYSQQKQTRVQEWCQKFQKQAQNLREQAIKIDYKKNLSQVLESIPSYFEVKQFNDRQNEYLLTTARKINSISSNEKQNKDKRKSSITQNEDQTKRNVFDQKQNGVNGVYDQLDNKIGKNNISNIRIKK